MNTSTFLSELGRRGISIRPEGDQLRYRAPRGALSPDLLAQIRERKAELLAELDQEARAIPILEIRTLVRTEAGVEVVEVASGDSSHRRWEKRLCFGGVCALVGEVTNDSNVARLWVEALQAADPGNEGATSPLGEMK